MVISKQVKDVGWILCVCVWAWVCVYLCVCVHGAQFPQLACWTGLHLGKGLEGRRLEPTAGGERWGKSRRGRTDDGYFRDLLLDMRYMHTSVHTSFIYSQSEVSQKGVRLQVVCWTAEAWSMRRRAAGRRREEAPCWVLHAAQTVTHADNVVWRLLEMDIRLRGSSCSPPGVVSLYRSFPRKSRWIGCPAALWNLFSLFYQSA